MKKNNVILKIFLILLALSVVGLITSGIIYSATSSTVAIISLFVFTFLLFFVLFPPMYIGYLKQKKWIFFWLSAIFHIALSISIIPFGVFKYVSANEPAEMIALGVWGVSLLGLCIVIAIDNTISEIKKSKSKKQ